jgi:hypothetical protein
MQCLKANNSVASVNTIHPVQNHAMHGMHTNTIISEEKKGPAKAQIRCYMLFESTSG